VSVSALLLDCADEKLLTLLCSGAPCGTCSSGQFIGRAHPVGEPFPYYYCFTALRLLQGHESIATTKDNEHGCHHDRYLHAPQDAPEHFPLTVRESAVIIGLRLLSPVVTAPKISLLSSSTPPFVITHTFLIEFEFSSTDHPKQNAAGSFSALRKKRPMESSMTKWSWPHECDQLRLFRTSPVRR
jgi:hypothetical protein